MFYCFNTSCIWNSSYTSRMDAMKALDAWIIYFSCLCLSIFHCGTVYGGSTKSKLLLYYSSWMMCLDLDN